MSTSTPTPTVKIELKNKFAGDPGCVSEIIQHCEWKFLAESAAFADEKIKVIYLFSCCEGGTAGPWAVNYSKTLDTQDVAAGNAIFHSYKWKDVSKAFVNYFVPTDNLSWALGQLQLLKHSNTEDYCSQFESYRSISGLSNVEVFRQLFYNGLPEGLKQKIIAIDPENTNSCEKLYACARRLDSQWKISMGDRRKHGGGSGGGGNYRGGFQKKNQGQRLRRLTDADRAQLMKEGRCFRCREIGHMANENKCRNRGGGNIRATEVDPAEQIRGIIAGIKDSDTKEKVLKDLEDKGF